MASVFSFIKGHSDYFQIIYTHSDSITILNDNYLALSQPLKFSDSAALTSLNNFRFLEKGSRCILS